MATKTENVETLYQAGVDTKTNLKKLDPEVLDQMVADLNKEDEQPTIEVEKVEETASEVEVQADETTADETEVIEGEVVAESVVQLGIFTEFIYHAKNEGVSIKVQNLGNGDVYAHTGKVSVGNKEQRLLKGDTRVLENAVGVNLMAASQPEVKITEIK